MYNIYKLGHSFKKIINFLKLDYEIVYIIHCLRL